MVPRAPRPHAPRPGTLFAGCAVTTAVAGVLLLRTSPAPTTLAALVVLVVGLGAASPWAPLRLDEARRAATRSWPRRVGLLVVPLVAVALVALGPSRPVVALAMIVAVVVVQWVAALALARRDARRARSTGDRPDA